jgi:hypothetical protein
MHDASTGDGVGGMHYYLIAYEQRRLLGGGRGGKVQTVVGFCDVDGRIIGKDDARSGGGRSRFFRCRLSRGHRVLNYVDRSPIYRIWSFVPTVVVGIWRRDCWTRPGVSWGEWRGGRAEWHLTRCTYAYKKRAMWRRICIHGGGTRSLTQLTRKWRHS